MEVMEINEKLSEVQSLADLDEMRTSNNGMFIGLFKIYFSLLGGFKQELGGIVIVKNCKSILM